MTRKDYVLIAAALKRVTDAYANEAQLVQDAAIDCATELATVLANDNPRFDRARFLTACGVQS